MRIFRWFVRCLYVAAVFAGVFAAPTAAAAPTRTTVTDTALAPRLTAVAAAFVYRSGWTVQYGWLCYGFSDGVYHCTSHWTTSNGRYVSYNTPFVPSQAGSGAPVVGTPLGTTTAGMLPSVGRVVGSLRWAPGWIPNDSVYATQAAPYGGALSLWKVPPAPYNAVYYPNRYYFPYQPGYPWCTWWSREMSWALGHGTGSSHLTPRVGAAIHYNPYVLGASSAGHWGHVIAVYTNGWVLSAEMNFWWRGGGSGRVIFRFVPARYPGVSYIY